MIIESTRVLPVEDAETIVIRRPSLDPEAIGVARSTLNDLEARGGLALEDLH